MFGITANIQDALVWYRERPNGPESPLGLLVCSIIGSPGIKTAVTLRDRPKVHKEVSRREEAI